MRLRILFIVCLLATICVADEKRDPQSQVDARRASIEKMKEQDRAEEYAKLALDLTTLATEQYQADVYDKANETARSIGDAAIKAADSGRIKRKKLKQAELALRECNRRLEQLVRTLPVNDQGALRESIKAVEKARKDILETMFR